MYDFFDKIICINLSSRSDKKHYVETIFKKINIQNVEFYKAKPHPKGGRYGCFDSHLNVIASAYKAGCSNILIFEDDVRPSPTYNEEHIENAIHFLSTQPNIDILQLGHFPFQNENGLLNTYIGSKRVPNFPNILRFPGTGAHAYCLTKLGMKAILESNWRQQISHEHYDIFLVNLNLNHYVYIPTLFDQNFCLGSNNVPTSRQERFLRNYECIIADYHLNNKISKMKYYEYYIKVIIVIIIVLIFLIYNLRKS
jgi:GR25 family glycosyltransferase involved in LPS biosynthesis